LAGTEHSVQFRWLVVDVCNASVSSTFTCTLKFVVEDCDPNTGLPEDEGYEDEYVVSMIPLGIACRRQVIPTVMLRHTQTVLADDRGVHQSVRPSVV